MDANVLFGDGETPLHIASDLGLFEVVVWLIEKKGAMITPLNYFNQTPCDIARVRGHKEIVTYLVAKTRNICKRLSF